jgi:hypothetical protein
LTKSSQSFRLDGIKEVAVPLVQSHLADHVADEDDDEASGEPDEWAALRRTPQCAQETAGIAPDAVAFGGCSTCSRAILLRGSGTHREVFQIDNSIAGGARVVAVGKKPQRRQFISKVVAI